MNNPEILSKYSRKTGEKAPVFFAILSRICMANVELKPKTKTLFYLTLRHVIPEA